MLNPRLPRLRMSIERKAQILNGMIVVVAGLLTASVDPRFVWLVLIMGASLMFSGAADYCGFAVILRRFENDNADATEN